MLATDFTRCDCQVGRKRRTYETLCREWRCNECSGRVVIKWSDEGRHPECGRSARRLGASWQAPQSRRAHLSHAAGRA